MGTPADMSDIRREIDSVDTELVQLLARRQRLVELAGQVKRGQSREAVEAPDRVAAVITDRRELAALHGLDPDVAEAVWRAMIEAFIALELRVHAEE